MKIGFIGLGIMGSRMAANLQQNGHELVLYNRTKAKAEALLAQGATWADSPAAVAEQVSLLITMLAAPDVVEQLAMEEGRGFLDKLPDDALWVDCSTVNPSFSQAMAQQAATRNIRFIDAPVAGSKDAAENGTLLFIVGGNDEDVAQCKPLFEAMGRATRHVGESGRGTALKMVVNMLLAEAMVAFAEGMALGQALGFSKELLLETLVGGPVVAPFIEGKKPKIAANEYETEFPLKLMQKDLHLAATTAYEQGVALPSANVAKEIYALAVRHGLGEEDFSAIYKFLVD